MNVLDAVIDKFILVEAKETFSGKPKDLIFEANKARFSRFLHKIDYLVIDKFPDVKDNWAREDYQRNYIKEGLTKLRDDDLVIISDVDEIPNPDTIKSMDTPKSNEVYALEQTMFYYYLNCYCKSRPDWLGSRIVTYKYFKNPTIAVKPEISDRFVRSSGAANIIRFTKSKVIENGGWHFSFLGGINNIISKVQAYAHQENNNEKYLDRSQIIFKILMGRDIFERPLRYSFKNIDKSYPEYLIEHKKKYAALIFDTRFLLLRRIGALIENKFKEISGARLSHAR